MILNFSNLSLLQKCEIKCPEPRKRLTTQYKFCLMGADAKCWGVGSMRTPADNGGRVVFYGWPLGENGLGNPAAEYCIHL